MSAQTAKNIEFDEYGEDSGIFSTLLWYGLFVGAIFQVICICVSLFLPPHDSESDSVAMDDPKQGIEMTSNARRQHKLRKQEKKKRR